ncbi:MAG TPA: hypothetical protein VG713_16770, partial [Pirellulales bacterium]|nr:hypothetical protein [Pirellulales bacterium]
HHVNVFLCPPGSHDSVEVGSFGSQCLVASAAGTGATIFPPGMAKRIPAGWRLRFVVHYVAIGSEQTDRSSLGLKFIDPELVEREVATRVLIDPELRIAPGAANHRIEHAAVLERDTLLLAMFPHMHLRGKSFLYQAAYADGRRETLLSVPRWDFEWQHRYELAKPKLLPAGTVLHCIAIYDNSAANPANPDPRAMVRAGPQNDDEMFNAYYDIAPAETAAFGTGLRTRWVVRGLTTLMAAIVIGWFATRERGPG